MDDQKVSSDLCEQEHITYLFGGCLRAVISLTAVLVPSKMSLSSPSSFAHPPEQILPIFNFDLFRSFCLLSFALAFLVIMPSSDVDQRDTCL